MASSSLRLIRNLCNTRALHRSPLLYFSHFHTSPKGFVLHSRRHPLATDPSEPFRTKWTSRVFCSQTSYLNDAQGPSSTDYGSLLQEEDFHRLADATIHDLEEKFEEYGDCIQIDGFDLDCGNQVLTLKLGNLGTYVLNKQAPNRQIWLSSPVSGPSRFDWDATSRAWIYRRTKANLLRLLEAEMVQLCGKPIDLNSIES